MSEHQVVQLSKSQLLETITEKLLLKHFYEINPIIREITLEQLFGLDDDFSNLKSLGLNKIVKFFYKKCKLKFFVFYFFKN